MHPSTRRNLLVQRYAMLCAGFLSPDSSVLKADNNRAIGLTAVTRKATLSSEALQMGEDDEANVPISALTLAARDELTPRGYAEGYVPVTKSERARLTLEVDHARWISGRARACWIVVV